MRVADFPWAARRAETLSWGAGGGLSGGRGGRDVEEAASVWSSAELTGWGGGPRGEPLPVQLTAFIWEAE